MNNLQKIKGYLIEEAAYSSKPEIMHQSHDGPIKIKVTLQDADVPNRNNRIYTRRGLESGINTPYAKERLQHKAWYGEAGHPLKPDMARQMYIDQTRISHLITSVWFEGNALKATVESAQTAIGKDFKGLILQGSEVAFSMRGVGPVTEGPNGCPMVNAPLNILTWDWVIHPSHKVAYMENILSESTMNMLTGKDQYSLSEASDYQLNQLHNQVLTEGLINPLEQFEIIDYIKSSSSNFKNLSEAFEFTTNGNEVKINEDRKSVDIFQNSQILRVYLEDYIIGDIDNYLLTKLR